MNEGFPQAIPFTSTDRDYLARIDLYANEVREAIKQLKMLIADFDGEPSAAFQLTQQHHDQWKAICSQTFKAIRAASKDGAA